MKNLYKLRMALTLFLLVAGMATALAQQLKTTGVYKHGTNSGGTVATENPDLITQGTTVLYVVKPDPMMSPTWESSVTTDPTITTGIPTSTSWLWTIPAEVGALNTGLVKTDGHFIWLDAQSTLTPVGPNPVIKVQELNGSACNGSSKSIEVRVIAKPAVNSLTLSSDIICGDNVAGDGALAIDVPAFNLSTTLDGNIPGNALVKVKADVVYNYLDPVKTDKTFSDIVINVGTDGVLSVTDIETATGKLNNWGTVTLTIKAISDKISRKDINSTGGSDLGYFSANVSKTFTILKPPTTGDIYHLPNN